MGGGALVPFARALLDARRVAVAAVMIVMGARDWRPLTYPRVRTYCVPRTS